MRKVSDQDGIRSINASGLLQRRRVDLFSSGHAQERPNHAHWRAIRNGNARPPTTHPNGELPGARSREQCRPVFAPFVSGEGAVIRPFGLRHIDAVRRLQRHGVWLDHYHYLVQRRTALTTALIAPIPWVATGLASYVWQSAQGIQGFVQMFKRPGQGAVDLLFLAPGIDPEPSGAKAWRTLLDFCVQNAGRHGARRLYASLPISSAEIDVLAGLGFGVYTNENIYALSRVPRDPRTTRNESIRPQHQNDEWWLRRLYNLYTPPPVQHAEGMGDREDLTTLPTAWWERSQQHGYVLTRGGEIHGALQVVSGRRGHWLLLQCDPTDSQCVTGLVERGLAAMEGSRWPVYCAARDFQGGLAAVLQDYGFQWLTERSCLVKHLTIPARVAERSAVPGLIVERSS